jgi:hypothetical protein
VELRAERLPRDRVEPAVDRISHPADLMTWAIFRRRRGIGSDN